MKHALIAASLVLVAGTTAGCGGSSSSNSSDDGAPTAASEKDFCAGFATVADDMQGMEPGSEPAEMIKILKSGISDLEETGTPEDIPADARDGFELTVDMVNSLDEDASPEDLAKMEEQFSDEDKGKVDAFDAYLSETCPDL